MRCVPHTRVTACITGEACITHAVCITFRKERITQRNLICQVDKSGFFVGGSGWIRTPTHRVRVCRATVTQFPIGTNFIIYFFKIMSRYFYLFLYFLPLFLKIILVFFEQLCYDIICLGGVAQLGERLNGIQEVMGSIPTVSTKK